MSKICYNCFIMKKNITIGLVLLIIALLGIYLFTKPSSEDNYQNEIDSKSIEVEQTEQVEENTQETVETPGVVAIGKSAGGRDIVAYRYGTGEKEVLLVGGIHGGYSWNTSLLGYQMVDYFDDKESEIPSNVTLSIIPVLNPDGLNEVAGTYGPFNPSDIDASETELISGRFNGNNVDLNRNFDCDWESVGTWQNREVDGGSAAFSEPESQAIRNYINQYGIDSAIVYYSSAGGVFASNCYGGILPETRSLTNEYADASGYPAYEEFNFYEITGDMVNWMAKMEIPAISVLLSDHNNTEWSRNLEGVKAVLDYYAE
jgi:hypothetical protein